MVYKSSSSISDTETTRVCTKCNTEKPLEQFHKANGGRHRRRVCKVCQHKRQAVNNSSTPEKIAHRRRQAYKYKLKEYGLTLESFDALLLQQNGQCKICDRVLNTGEVDSVANVDHCHKTGIVRGILCFVCNTGLGKFKDSPELLGRAKKYLEDRNAFYRIDSSRYTSS